MRDFSYMYLFTAFKAVGISLHSGYNKGSRGGQVNLNSFGTLMGFCQTF